MAVGPSASGSSPSLVPSSSGTSSHSQSSHPVLRPFRSLSLLNSSSGATSDDDSALERTTLGPEPPPIESPYSENAPELGEDGPEERSTDWRSIYVASFLSFCCSVQFSLYFSSMWQYLQILDKSATERFFGYIVAVYSLGQILGSPLVGHLSNRMQKIRHLLYGGLLLMLSGNGLYMAAHLFPHVERKYLLAVARFVTGIGSSNISLLKAYASTASMPQDRSRAIAFVTGGVALGMTMGPAFQLLFTPIGYPGFPIVPWFPKLHLSMYTAPALLACVMNLLNALCIKTAFRENYAGLLPTSKLNGGDAPALPPYDLKAVLLCHATRFTQMFVNTNLETLGAPLAMMMFAWTRTETVAYFSTAQAVMSFLAFLTYLVFIVFRVDKIMNFRTNMMCSLVALILFHAATYSYPFLPGRVKTYSGRTVRNHTEAVGCDTDKFSWCDRVHPVPPMFFYTCYILAIGLAFPNINVALNTLFSKIIGPRRQGTQQGLLQMSGASARMVGPVVISSLYTSYGPQSAWMMEIAVIASTLALWVVLYRRMVPLAVSSEQLESGQEPKPAVEEEPSSSQPSSLRRKKKYSAEEKKPLVVPIEEEEGDVEENRERDGEGEEEEGQGQLDRNDATVTTVISLG